MEKLNLVVENSDDIDRIDKYIYKKLVDKEQTRSSIQKLIENGNILVNDVQINKNYKLRLGDQIEIILPDPIEYEAIPENIPLDIVYEDDDLLVVNKPKGMVVHPAPGNYSGTLVNALMYHCGESLSGINGVLRPGIVHRIDKDTSGLLIVAKNDFAHRGLAEQIKYHTFKRKYQAIIHGHLKNQTGTINAPIGRHPVDRKKMAVVFKNSKEAITHYRVISENEKYSFIELELETGRTHQIRVHMSSIGHPIIGDTVYGGVAQKGFNGQCLHAKLIGFIHPRTNQYLEFDSSLPAYFNNYPFFDK